jgi:serine/threonine-protein kinase
VPIVAPDAGPVRTGEMIGNRYRLDKVLGSGGQSVVYRAEDVRFGDSVAIKILNPQAATNPEWVERMFREARATATLRGTSAVKVLDQQWTNDGAMCLVMELLQGVDLEDHLTALESRGEKMAAQELLEILAPVVATLESAHAQGIVHRDLKPSNIFIIDSAQGGGVRLLDFGFAKFVRMRAMTAFGTIAGSPTYIAPEGWKADPMKLDHRIDVYAMGAIVFRALGGKPAFAADNLFDLVKAVTAGPRPSLVELRPDLPSDVDDWLKQSLAIEPEERFFQVRGQYNALKWALGS